MWRMLYETAACWAEVFALNVEDLDLPGPQPRLRPRQLAGLPGVSVVPGWLGDAARLGDDDGEGAGLGDAARLGDDDGEGAGLDEGPAGLLSDGRPELGGLPGRVTPGESHGPVSAPGAAGAVEPDGGPAGAARPGGPAG